jgi:hypothetical protein
MQVTIIMKSTAIRKTGEIDMGYFKNLEIEIREMDFDGLPLQQIADRVGLGVTQVLEILDQINDEDIGDYADKAADLDADFYGRLN